MTGTLSKCHFFSKKKKECCIFSLEEAWENYLLNKTRLATWYVENPRTERKHKANGENSWGFTV